MPVLVACAAGVAIGLFVLWWSARTAITIAVVEIHEGRLELTRGGLSPRILQDLRDVAARPPIRRATVRILRAKDRARVEARGRISPQQVQRMRNVIGTVAVSQVMRAHRR